MSVQAEKNGQLTVVQGRNLPQKAEPPKTLGDLVKVMQSQIAMALPKHLSADRMVRIALTAIRTTRDLDKCSQASFMASLMSCAVLGLEPNTPLGQAYLLPFWSGKANNGQGGYECQLIIGYQGFLDLIRRSGLVASTQAFAVYEGDVFEYELGLNPKLKHIPSALPDRENPDKLTHTYCVIRLKDKDAEPIFLVMPRTQIEKRKLRGAAGKKNRSGQPVFTPWSTDYEAMALKTVVRAAVKWAPRSAEMALAADVDERSERGDKIAPALPPEVTEHLLQSGHATEQDFVDTTGETKEYPAADPDNDGR